jgi:hypothetical protein
MNRALKILSVAVILFLAYMWVSILYKSCNKNSEFDDFQEDIVQTDTEVPSLTDDYQEEPFLRMKVETIVLKKLNQKKIPLTMKSLMKK